MLGYDDSDIQHNKSYIGFFQFIYRLIIFSQKLKASHSGDLRKHMNENWPFDHYVAGPIVRCLWLVLNGIVRVAHYT